MNERIDSLNARASSASPRRRARFCLGASVLLLLCGEGEEEEEEARPAALALQRVAGFLQSGHFSRSRGESDFPFLQPDGSAEFLPEVD